MCSVLVTKLPVHENASVGPLGLSGLEKPLDNMNVFVKLLCARCHFHHELVNRVSIELHVAFGKFAECLHVLHRQHVLLRNGIALLRGGS